MYGADINFAGDVNLPPIHLASMCGNIDIVELLVDKGVALQSVDFVHFSALHCATYFNHEKVSLVLNNKCKKS